MTNSEIDHPHGKRRTPTELFGRYKDCIVRVQVTLPNGELANGTAFHIGGGVYVTARHVVEKAKSLQLYTGDSAYEDENGHEVNDILYADEGIDLALITSTLNIEFFGDHGADDLPRGEPLSFIPLPEMWGEWIEDSLMLTTGIICGYPRVPFSKYPNLVAVTAEINADIDRYDKGHVHFIVSSVARGGFSGAPFISEFDFLLGVVTESLIPDNPETPFMAVIAIEPLYDIIERNEKILKGRLDHFLTSWSKNKQDKIGS